jgi:hypothetical protein
MDMSDVKTPVRVNDIARPEKDSDLVEVVKRNGDFRQNYGPLLGAFLFWLSLKATRPRSLLWSGMVALGTAAGGYVLKYGIPGL